jgi:hypothetical protein
MPIEVLDYDNAWPGLADTARTELLTALAGPFRSGNSDSLPGCTGWLPH